MAFHRALILSLFLAAGMAQAQQATIAFSDMAQDTTQPVEVTADQLTVNNTDGTAVFSGNVTVTQGDMTLSAAEVLVTYGETPGQIDQLVASGGVTITNLADKARKLGIPVYRFGSGGA